MADQSSKKRRLTDYERALWQGFTRSIVPLKRGIAVNSATATERSKVAAGPRKPKGGSSPIERSNQAAAPFTSIERRTKQRLARGSDTLDARLDLHGKTQAEAHRALLGFLRRAQARGARIVLVITGKGGRNALPEGGILKRVVPLWLALPEFRAHAVGFERAHVVHGGDGAIYIRLRRTRAVRE
jgi:DNA-nicking Smr family endonuclease